MCVLKNFSYLLPEHFYTSLYKYHDTVYISIDLGGTCLFFLHIRLIFQVIHYLVGSRITKLQGKIHPEYSRRWGS